MEELGGPQHLQRSFCTVTIPQIGPARIDEHFAVPHRVDVAPARIIEDRLPILWVWRTTDNNHVRIPSGDLLHGHGAPVARDGSCIDAPGDVDPIIDDRLPTIGGEYAGG